MCLSSPQSPPCSSAGVVSLSLGLKRVVSKERQKHMLEIRFGRTRGLRVPRISCTNPIEVHDTMNNQVEELEQHAEIHHRVMCETGDVLQRRV